MKDNYTQAVLISAYAVVASLIVYFSFKDYSGHFSKDYKYQAESVTSFWLIEQTNHFIWNESYFNGLPYN